MNRFYRSLLLTGILATGLAGCGDDVTVIDPPPPPPPPLPIVRAVTVTPDNVTVNPGQTIQMTASVTADAGATPVVTWSTSDATRATVSTAGLVTIPAAAPTGPVAIRATATANGSTASGAATLSVVGTTITGVTVTPATATIVTNQTLQATASVQGSNNPSQAVNWSSLSPTVATVDANGLVTANATTGGNAVIKACAASNGNICGTLAVEVVVPSPATVSIQSVSFTNGTGQQVPVVLTNVFGQIEITLNVDNGSKTLSRVDALVGGQVVASQTFSSSNPAPVPGPDLAPVTVQLSVNTAQLRQNGGIFVPVIFNGNSAITANLFVVGTSTPIASNAIPVVMNNPDALVATNNRLLAPTSTTPSVLVGANTFYKGTQTVSGFDYIAFGKAVPATVTLGSTLCGASSSLVPVGATATSGIALTGTYACAAFEGSNTVAAPVTTAYAAGAVGPDGTPLTAPTGFNSVGSAFTVNSENRWNMIAPAVGALSAAVFVDNLAPVPTIGTVAFNAAFDQMWVNAAYAFSSAIGATDGGTGVATGFPEARQYTDGTFVPVSSGCSATIVTTGNDFAETTTSSNSAPSSTDWGKRICTYAEDQLGNAASSGPSNYFGVDKFAPLARIAGSTAATPDFAGLGITVPGVSATANTTIFSIAAPFVATDRWGIESLDGRSGFNQNAVAGFPAQESFTILNPANNPAVTYTSQTTVTCGLTDPLSTVLSDNYVRSAHLPATATLDCALGTPMYVWVNMSTTDRAGNVSTTITRNYAIDQYAAPVLASIGASTPLYTAGQPANFFLFGSDDLEIIEADLAITYPNFTAPLVSLTKPLSAIAGAARWDNTLTNILTATTVTDAFFLGRVDFTCAGAAAPYATCAVVDGKTTVAAEYNTVGTFTDDEMNPSGVGAVAYDVASQSSGAPVSTALLTAQTTDVAEQWAAADLVSWRVLTPTGTTVMAEHKASTSIVAPFFDSVRLGRGDVTPNPTTIIVCGTFPAPVLTDNGVNRFWTYNLTKPGAGTPCGTATGDWVAIGIKNAAGLVTQFVP